MEQALKRLEGESGNGLDKYRAGLIEKPNLLVLIDLPGLVKQGLKFATAVPELPIPIDEEQVEALQPVTSFIGFTLAAEPHALRARTRIPVEQAQGIIQLVAFFQMLRQQEEL
jgi:hypothetical protein